MAAPATPEKTAVVYYDDSTGEIYSKTGGHFEFTDLSGEHYREHQHGAHHSHKDHRAGNNLSSSSPTAEAAQQRAGTHGTTEPVDEGFLNTLLAAGINIPFEAYRAHQEEEKTQQRRKQQQAQLRPITRELHGRRGSPLLLHGLTEENADAYLSALMESRAKQRHLQAEHQVPTESIRRDGEPSFRTHADNGDATAFRSLLLSSQGRSSVGQDRVSSSGIPHEILRESGGGGVETGDCSIEELFDNLCAGFKQSQHRQRAVPGISASQQEQLNQRQHASRNHRDDGHASSRRRSNPEIHSARLVQTPHGLIVHFDSHEDSKATSQYPARPSPKNQSSVGGEVKVKIEEEQQPEVVQTGDDDQYRHLLTQINELAKIRALVELEEVRLVGRLKERDSEVYRSHRCAELQSRIRWAVEEQGRLTREAEDLVAAAREKYKRATRVGELATAAERALKALCSEPNSQAAGNCETVAFTHSGAGALDSLLRGRCHSGNPDLEPTAAGEKGLLSRSHDQSGAGKSANSESRPHAMVSPLLPGNFLGLGTASQVKGGGPTTRVVFGSSVNQPRVWKRPSAVTSLQFTQPF